jgi:hypothetical protein
MKNGRRISLGILALIFFTGPLLAGEPPAPRPPIGPRVNEMFPPGGLTLSPNPLGSDTVRIQNVGDQQLFLSYWDAVSTWKTLSIDAGRSTDIVCAKCAGTININYHDGKAQRAVKTQTGSVYLLGWSDQQGAWILTTSSR